MLWVPSDPRRMNQNKSRDMFLWLPLLKCVRMAIRKSLKLKAFRIHSLVEVYKRTRESH